MRSDAAPSLDDRDVGAILSHGSLELEGRLVAASNASFVGRVTLDGESLACIYKPVAGERPLWDFPHGSLAGREMAARLVSEAGGWNVVPPTVLRDGRFGPGMVQRWIDTVPEHELVDVVEDGFDEPGWIAVLEAEDQRGRPVLLVHADDSRLRDMAVFDVVINNADRKGGHVLVEQLLGDDGGDDGGDSARSLWGCDHGVSFHEDNKLRTVLWGWADDPLREVDRLNLGRLAAVLCEDLGARLGEWLTEGERAALTARIDRLLRSGRMPVPDGSWPAIPWPAF